MISNINQTIVKTTLKPPRKKVSWKENPLKCQAPNETRDHFPIIIEPLESENLSNMEGRSGPDGFLSERFECITIITTKLKYLLNFKQN